MTLIWLFPTTTPTSIVKIIWRNITWYFWLIGNETTYKVRMGAPQVGHQFAQVLLKTHHRIKYERYTNELIKKKFRKYLYINLLVNPYPELWRHSLHGATLLLASLLCTPSLCFKLLVISNIFHVFVYK